MRCQSLGGAFVDAGPEPGYVRWRADGSPEPWALIKRDQCHHLAAYVRSGARRPTRDQVVAVHVLTHEAMHMSGLLDEAVAECAAVQRDAQTPACSAPGRPTRPRWPPPTGPRSTR